MKNFTVIDFEQRSEEWYLARNGRVTGSCAADMLATLKSGGEAAAKRNYRNQLVVERLTGRPQDEGFTSIYAQRGLDVEPAALAAYEAASGNMVRTTGFLSHNDLMTGCSLDGDIDDFTGILELKGPKSTTHYQYLKDGKLPDEYAPQVTHNLWMTGAKWCDFCSFDDRFEDRYKLFTIRVNASDLDLAGYETKLRAFLTEIERDVKTMEDKQL